MQRDPMADRVIALRNEIRQLEAELAGLQHTVEDLRRFASQVAEHIEWMIMDAEPLPDWERKLLEQGLDPRWEWHHVQPSLGIPERWVRGRRLHAEV